MGGMALPELLSKGFPAGLGLRLPSGALEAAVNWTTTTLRPASHETDTKVIAKPENIPIFGP